MFKNKQEDLNVLAYINDLKTGKHKDLEPGTWVAYHNGVFVLSEKNKNIFFKKLKKTNERFFVAQIGYYKEPIHLPNVLEVGSVRSPRLAKNIKKNTKPKRA